MHLIRILGQIVDFACVVVDRLCHKKSHKRACFSLNKSHSSFTAVNAVLTY